MRVGKGQYIEIQPEELEAIALESKRTIEIDEFVPREQIDELYLKQPVLHRAGRASRRPGVRGDSRGDQQERNGRDRQGRLYITRAHDRA